MTTLDLADIQGLIVRGYHKAVARHVVLEIVDPESFRSVLANLIEEEDPRTGPFITVAVDWRDRRPVGEPAKHCVNLGFTFEGMKKLVSQDVLDSFPRAFQEGASERGEECAGETGDNHPSRWEPKLREEEEDVHAILSVYADDSDELRDVLSELDERIAGSTRKLWCIDANKLDGGKSIEHFGYEDGLSQPTIDGVERTIGLADPFDRVPPGEFVLGQPAQPGHPWETPPEIGDNGSFAAFRVMSQNVEGFNRFLADQARRTGLGEELLAAKVCGRWRNGDPLTLRPTSGSPEVPEDDRNMFDYESADASPHGDREGLGCPRGAHIRRAFPRSQRVIDDFDGFQRRIVRRGMPYGPKFDPANPTDEPRGLVGHFICASLANQYEYIMRRWINDGLFTGGRLGRTMDPLTGANDPANSRFAIPGEPDVTLTGFTQFVKTRWCAYLFLPSITALGKMARLEDPRSQSAA